MKQINYSRLREISNRYKNHHITAFSAQMAFFLFLSIFPLAMFILSIASRLNLNVDTLVMELENGLPQETVSMIMNVFSSYLKNDSLSLLSISGIAALWSASRGVHALMRAFNMAYGHKETRNFIKLKLTSMFYTLVVILSIIVTIALPAIGHGFFVYVNYFIPVSPVFVNLFSVIRIISNVVVYVFFILSIHKVLPAGHLKYKDTLYGSLFSIIGWLILSWAFNFFITTFSNYALIYGSLASMVTLMMWMYLMSTVMMLGAEINSTILAFKNNDYPFNQTIFIDE